MLRFICGYLDGGKAGTPGPVAAILISGRVARVNAMVKAKRKLVCGVGVNDADYQVYRKLSDGRVTKCQFYATWSKMLHRCYSEKCHKRQPCYKICTVCEEWLTFSIFKSWMEAQDWRGKQLDKDILCKGNKIYGPSRCCFVDQKVNLFLMDRASARGRFPTGVHWAPKDKKYNAAVRNPFIRKTEFLGGFESADEAHEAWRKRKHELACQYAEIIPDKRVADALSSRFEK